MRGEKKKKKEKLHSANPLALSCKSAAVDSILVRMSLPQEMRFVALGNLQKDLIKLTL